jgi:4-amino-4-deoxy-L-arabinose transferase-like glycosyltransferase
VKKWAWPALGLFVVACFWGFWSYGPFDLDEGLYSVALMEMQQRGDWVVPTMRGEPFFEKPILFYWTAWITDLCGADRVVALRLPSILATMGTLALVALFTKRIGPLMILSVSVLFMGVGRMFMPDPFLVFGMTAALFAFWKAREDSRWHVAAGLALAIAVLAKGPMPLVVFGLLWLYCRFRMPSFVTSAPLVSGWKVAGLVILLALTLPWYVLAALRSPVFVDEFLIKQNLGRLTGAGDSAHLGQIWLYIPVVLIGLLPFSLSLIGAWRKRTGELEQYLWAFVLIVFVLFSLAGTKLPHYILPIFPALAVLLHRYLSRCQRIPWEYAILMAILSVGLFIYGLFMENDGSLFLILLGLLLHTLVLGWLGSSALCYFKRGSTELKGMLAVAPFILVLMFVAPRTYWVLTHLDPQLAARIADAQHLPIVEYRTGGEGVRGKTAHPSMQWTIGKNTLAIDDFRDLRRVVRDGPVAVITRGSRLRRDEMMVSAALGRVELVFESGEWQVFVVSQQMLPN